MSARRRTPNPRRSDPWHTNSSWRHKQVTGCILLALGVVYILRGAVCGNEVAPTERDAESERATVPASVAVDDAELFLRRVNAASERASP